MLLEFRGSPVTVDKAPFMQNVRLNLAGNHQFRLKFEFLDKDTGQENPVDIVVYQYSSVGLDKFSLSISFNGEELKRGIKFNLKLSHDFMKHKWRISGRFGRHNVDKHVDTAIGIFSVVRELL